MKQKAQPELGKQLVGKLLSAQEAKEVGGAYCQYTQSGGSYTQQCT